MVSSTRVFTTRNKRIRLLICANFIAVIRYSIALSDNIKSPDVQPWAKHQAPKPKLQTPKKSQVPSSKPRPALRASNLELGASLVFGVWCLELGTWCFFGAWSLEL